MSLFDPAKYYSKRVPQRLPPAWEFTIPEHIVKHPSPISLGGGMPAAGFFPIKSLEVKVKPAPFAKGDTEEYVVKAVEEGSIDLKTGLQYSHPQGLAPIQAFIKDLVQKTNPPLYKEYKSTISIGNGVSINRVFDTILDDDDVVLIDQFNYLPVQSQAKDFKAKIIPLKVTDGKTDIEYMAKVLDEWSTVYPDLPKPKAFYTIPNGSNPFGVTCTLLDKKLIYLLLEKHDFLIVEDDPYGYITLPKYNAEEFKEYSYDEFLQNIGPSYLQLDTCGRVLRIETFSKVFAPGLRLGFIVAHEKFVYSINLYTFGVTGQLSAGPSQILTYNTILQMGGVEGFLQWVHKMSNEYAKRTHNVLKLLYGSQAYKEGKFTVREPDAGMFITLAFNSDIQPLIRKTIETGVAVVAGTNMKLGQLAYEEEEAQLSSNFIRITTASLVEDDLKEAVNRLITAIELTY